MHSESEIEQKTEYQVTEPQPVIDMSAVSVWSPEEISILDRIDWRVGVGEHWALIGPNGSGKSTLLSLAAATRHPSQGRVTVLGETLGKTSLWNLREQIGFVNPVMPQYDWFTVNDIVLTGATGTIQPRWECYGDAEQARADHLMTLLGCLSLKEREIVSCSQGERQRVRIARALMPNPPLLLLDEPATGLDLLAREALIVALAELAVSEPSLSTVVVSHHLEELPPTTTHAMLLRDGKIVASGFADDVITSEHISASFGFDVRVRREDERWVARAGASWRTKTGVRRAL